MGSADGSQDEADRLLDRARTEPSTVDVSRLVDALASPDRGARGRAARAYTLAVEEDADVVDEAASELVRRLEQGEDGERNGAALTIAQLADRHPDAYAEAVPPLVETVGRPFDHARNNSLLALAELAPEYPDEVSRSLPALAELLEGDLVGRVRSLQVIAALSDRRPAIVGDHLEDVLAIVDGSSANPVRDTDERAPFQGADVDDERSLSYRQWTLVGRIVGNVAAEEPAAFVPGREALRSHLTADSTGRRSTAVHVLSIAAPKAPSAVEPLADVLFDVATGDEPPETRFRGSVAVCGIGLACPDRVADLVVGSLPELDDLLGASDPRLAGAAIGLLATAAEVDPEPVADRAGEIRALLDHDLAYVRANAALAAGHVGDEAALPALRDLADDDPDDEVRAAAADAVSTLGAGDHRA